MLWQSSENQIGQPKKFSQKFWNFSNFAQKIGQNRGFLVFWESSENQFCQPKKCDKIFEIFQISRRKMAKTEYFNALGELGESILST